jgi:hypothetical protein
MGGDGMGGMALAILIAMLLMLAFGFGLALLSARGIARRVGGKSGLWGLGAGLGGLALATLAITATFYESTWAPPPRLELSVPAGYAHDWTIILEDRTATRTLTWSRSALPFVQSKATLNIPASGVVRVQSLGKAGGIVNLDVRWSDGAWYSSIGGGRAPAGTGARTYIMVDHNIENGNSVQSLDTEKLAEVISAREQAR